MQDKESSEAKNNYKMFIKKIKNKDFNTYMYNALEEHCNEISNEFESAEYYWDKHEFSDKYKAFVNDLIYSDKNAYISSMPKIKPRHSFKQVVLVTIIAIMLLILVAFSIPNIKNAIVNYFISPTDECYVVTTNFKPNDIDLTMFEIPEVPDGYELDDGIIANHAIMQHYILKDSDKYINIHISTVGMNLTISDTFELKETTIHDIVVYEFHNSEEYIFVFNDDYYMYRISASDRNEAYTIVLKLIS